MKYSWLILSVMVWVWGMAVSLGASPVRVSVMIAPLSTLVKQIGGDLVIVTPVVPPGASPHVFEPKPSAIRALRDAQLIVTIPNIGLTVADPDTLKRLAPKATVLDLTMGEQLIGDSHGHGGDPHIWLSPAIMARQTHKIAAALSTIDPQHRREYQANAKRLDAQFESMIRQYRPIIAPKKIAVVAVHPSLTYLARDLGFVELSVETHGRAPSAKVLSELVVRAKKHPHRVVLVQPQYAQSTLSPISDQLRAGSIKLDVYTTQYPDNIVTFIKELAEVNSIK